MDAAKAKLQELLVAEPGDYFILDQVTGKKLTLMHRIPKRTKRWVMYEHREFMWQGKLVREPSKQGNDKIARRNRRPRSGSS